MKTGKEIILAFCKSVETHDIDYLQRCLDNEKAIEQEDYGYLEGCPSNYGLDDYIGLCEIETSENSFEQLTYQEQCKMCDECWIKALNTEVEK